MMAADLHAISDELGRLGQVVIVFVALIAFYSDRLIGRGLNAWMWVGGILMAAATLARAASWLA